MNAMAKDNDTKDEKPSRWYVLLACGLIGAAGGYIGTDLITGGANGQPLIDIGLSEGIALFLGGILLVCLVIVGIGFGIPKAGMAMSMFEDREQWEDERTMMLLSGLGGGAYAAVLIMLALAEPFQLYGSIPALAVIGALLIVFVYTGWRLLHEYDELWQGVNSETCTFGLYVTMGVGGIWSILAHLGFVGALSPLDWISLMTASCIAGSIISAQRRGMLED